MIGGVGEFFFSLGGRADGWMDGWINGVVKVRFDTFTILGSLQNFAKVYIRWFILILSKQLGNW